MKFDYQVRTKKGEIQTGVVEASSKEAALSLLQKYDFYVTYLEETSIPFYEWRPEFFRKVSLKDVVLFSRQLSMMFSAKVPLVESLRVLADQSKNMELREKVFNLSEEVEAGTAFSKALSYHPKVFSVLYVSMVKAGEISGKLAEALDYLAEHLEKEYHFNSKTKGALVYPALVLFLVILVVLLMIFTVIPQLKTVLIESGTQIPAMTATVISASDFVKSYGSFILMGIFAIFLLVSRYRETEGGRKTIDKIALELPLIGSFMQTLYLSRFASNLSTLISGGLMIGQALELSADIIGNSVYKKAILSIKDEVRKGMPISAASAFYPDLFPSVFTQMTMVGEKTGSLDVSLLKISNFYQAEVERGLANMLTILEPALILVLGLVVGGLMFSILMPLYQVMTV